MDGTPPGDSTDPQTLLLRGGRVIDPAGNVDAVHDVLFSGGKVAAVATTIDPPAGTLIRDVSGLIVAPGLIDLHTHVYRHGTSLGIDADDFARLCGVTTAVDAGSAGPGNFAGFRSHVIEQADVRILAFLHIAFPGIFAYSEKGTLFPESSDLSLMAPDEALEVIEANRDVIVGVKVRIGPTSSGNQSVAPLRIARDVAHRAGLPVMVHVEAGPPTIEEILAELGADDILTHSFRPSPNAAVADGTALPAVLDARRRGVRFDVGHGKGSLAFATTRTLLGAGFAPDSISSDIHVASIGGPVHDQLMTLSKFLCLGMDLVDVLAAATANPAGMIGRPDLGTLVPGSVGDATVLSLDDGSFDYVDSRNEHLRGSRRLALAAVVIGGRWWHESGPNAAANATT